MARTQLGHFGTRCDTVGDGEGRRPRAGGTRCRWRADLGSVDRRDHPQHLFGPFQQEDPHVGDLDRLRVFLPLFNWHTARLRESLRRLAGDSALGGLRLLCTAHTGFSRRPAEAFARWKDGP